MSITDTGRGFTCLFRFVRYHLAAEAIIVIRVLFLNTVNQSVVSCIQSLFNCLELRSVFDYNKALASHVASVNMGRTNKIGLSQLPSLSDFSYILAYAKILLDLLLHTIIPCGLILAHSGIS